MDDTSVTSSSSTTSSTGKLSDFTILQQLGKGSYGTVYKVKRHADNEIYCMKVINVAMMSIEEQMNALKEIEVMSSISIHPHIVSYYDSFVCMESQSLYIIMEYC